MLMYILPWHFPQMVVYHGIFFADILKFVVIYLTQPVGRKANSMYVQLVFIRGITSIFAYEYD